jgi:glutathione S-transferase
MSLADLHPVAMIEYVVQAPEIAALLARHPSLQKWFETMSARPGLSATAPR